MIPFGEYRPDQPALGPFCQIADNVIPAADGYRPLSGATVFSNALTARCQGAFASGGTYLNFAGDATKLYTLSSATWSDVTRAAGGAYACPSDGFWDFCQFGSVVFAANGSDALQSWTLGSSTNFAAASGSPPTTTVLATVRDFLVLGNGTTITWSGINDATTFAASQTTQSDSQVLPDGDTIKRIVGGEFGIVLQRRAVRRMDYAGVPVIFAFSKIDDQHGCIAPRSVASLGPSFVVYLGDDDFYLTNGTGPSRPLGVSRIAKTFFADLDQTYLDRVTAVMDPINGLYICAYPGAGNTSGNPNRWVIWNWKVDRWSTATVDCEDLFSSLTQAVTLEGLDTLYPSGIDSVPFSLDAAVFAGGLPRIGLFDLNHKLNYLSGSNLEATVESGEMQIFPGQRARVNSIYPWIDGGTPLAYLGVRETPQGTVTYKQASTPQADGFQPVRASGRFHRGKVVMSAGETWTHIKGFDVEPVALGRR